MNYVLKAVLLSVSALLLVSCSKSNNKAPNIDPRTGKHPSGWAVSAGGNHTTAFLSVPSSCYECHGKDLVGGISKVSCFSASRSGISCHANGPGQHPAGWSDAAVHGVHAKSAATGVDGLTHCQVCHGSDYSGGNVKKSCLNTAGCHGAAVSAPHAAKPWLSRLGASSHHNTGASNAPACAACHTAGANSARSPSPPAPAGTAPGCFNNTLCHGVEGHVTGWNLPANHGAAAKAAVGGDKGFSACVVCHGANYAGGTALQSCLNAAGCHGAGVNSPHPATPWRAHSATDTSNSPQCAVCHTNGANSTRSPLQGDPVGVGGCFNNTLCHGVQGHAAGWAAVAVHGAEAKKAPSGNTGFSSCQPCHGTTFNNGTAPTCMNNAACHGSGVNSPHARKPWFSRVAGQPTHTTTDTGNVGICAACHTGGDNSTLGNANAAAGTAGCFNNTLCHFHQIPFAPSATVPVTLHSSEAKKDLSVCQGCHGTRGTPAFDGATLADGTRTIACSSCHTSAKAHPTDWQGSGTYSHRTAGNINVACIICHDVTQGRTAPLAASPSCFSATFKTRACHASGPGVAPHAVPYNNHIAVAGGPSGNTTNCLVCHQVAATTTGRPGCQNCHLTSPVATPTGCTSCHANPPGGVTYPNIASMHAQHVNASKVTVMTLTCADCHTGLGLGTPDHLERARARTASVQANPVVFSDAVKLAGGGTASAFTSGANGQCTNVYCHGAKMSGGDTTGTNRTPTWNIPFLPATISAAACGACHGFPPLPGSGHPTLTTAVPATFGNGSVAIGTSCSCHSNISTAGTTYANIFVNKAQHIDGALQVSGVHAVPYDDHNAAVLAASGNTECLGCHTMGTVAVTGTYPNPTVGAAPNCMSCHRKAAPLHTGTAAGANCSSCHGTGTATTVGTKGIPTGSAFPDLTRGHSRGDHKVVCTTCHVLGASGGTGSGINHGRGSIAGPVRDGKANVVGSFVTGITVTGGGVKGTSPTSVSCNHDLITGAGCSGNGTNRSW